jgi:hypothetical protein
MHRPDLRLAHLSVCVVEIGSCTVVWRSLGSRAAVLVGRSLDLGAIVLKGLWE